MRISVIVPVFNVETYLSECIESVIGQTHNDFEIIMVDDGSTDHSPIICDQYAECYPLRIIAIHIENRGPLHARIRAMERATGDVFVFLDADDCLRNDALEQIAQCFEKQDCDMVLFDAGKCDHFATRQIHHSLEPWAVLTDTSKKLIYEKMLSGQIPNSVCLKAVRVSSTEFPKLLYRCQAKHGEDLLLSAHFITNCNKIVYLAEGLYHYRIRPGSAVHSFDIYRKESIKTVHTELEKYIEKWNIPELKPLHNTRKVRGWIEDLKLLLKHRSTLSNGVFCDQLRSMATDPYFRNAYNGMDSSRLSRADRILAFCLMKKQYFLLRSASHVLNMRKK